jgi:hypothetical protein
VIRCLAPLEKRPDFDYNKVLFEVKKQNLLEEFETSKSPDTDKWVNDIKDLKKFSSSEEFDAICSVLKLENINDSEAFENWSIYGGRIDCFNKCLSYLSKIYPYPESKRFNLDLNNILERSSSSTPPPAAPST